MNNTFISDINGTTQSKPKERVESKPKLSALSRLTAFSRPVYTVPIVKTEKRRQGGFMPIFKKVGE